MPRLKGFNRRTRNHFVKTCCRRIFSPREPTRKKTKRRRRSYDIAKIECTPTSTRAREISTPSPSDENAKNTVANLLEIFKDYHRGRATDIVTSEISLVRDIMKALRPLCNEILNLELRVEDLLRENAMLKKQVHELQKVNSRLRDARKTRLNKDACAKIWTCFKILAGCSYKDLRLLRFVEATCRGNIRNHVVPSEPLIQRAYRQFCKLTEGYMLSASDLNPEWQGHYVDVAKLLTHDLQFHTKELLAQFVEFGMKTQEVKLGVKVGLDGAPMTNSETWFIGSLGLNCFKKNLGEVFNRLAVLLPYPEEHPCTKAVINDICIRLKQMNSSNVAEFRMTQRRKILLKIDYVATVTDWAMKTKILRCLPAGSTAFTAYENVSMDNIEFLLGKRGDDSSLKLLSFPRRMELGKEAREHYENIEAQLKAQKRSKQQIKDAMARERLNYSMSKGVQAVNPQMSEPLELGRVMLMEWLHAGLRLVPKDIDTLHRLCYILYENGFSENKNVVPDVLEDLTTKSELTSNIKNLRESKSSDKMTSFGNIIGRMADLIQSGYERIFAAVKGACGTSKALKLIVTARYFIATRHRQILGLLKKDRDITDECIEEILNLGKDAFTVWYVFFKTTKPSPYQIALEFEAGALLKKFVCESGERYISRLSAQFAEHENSNTKTTVHTIRSFVKNTTEIGIKKNEYFKKEWRTKTFQPFVVDYIKKIESLRQGMYTNAQLERKSDCFAKLLPESKECEYCLHTISGDACLSSMCESYYMQMIVETSRTGELPHRAKDLWQTLTVSLRASLTKVIEPELVHDVGEPDNGNPKDPEVVPVPRVSVVKKTRKRYAKPVGAAPKRRKKSGKAKVVHASNLGGW